MKVIDLDITNGRKVHGSKIEEARKARRLSLAQLAEKIGVTDSAISKYERELSKPSSKILIKLSDVLEFPIGFFLTKSINDDVEDSMIYFRSNKNITKKLKEACKVRIHWIDNAYKFIDSYFELPKVNLPDWGNLDIDNLDEYMIEELAEKLREYWGIGEDPIQNMINLLQKNGFIITKLSIGTSKIDGFSMWKNNKPYIFIGKEKNSAVRSRFDLAHELGHLILHNNIARDDFENERDILEKQADIFAGAFLLPRTSFSREMINSSIDSLVLLKRKWKVSISAMIKRIERLDILTENQVKYLKDQMRKYKYYKNEPLDNLLEGEKPYLFKQSFQILIDQNIIRKEEILSIFNINKNEIIELFALNDNFFSDDKMKLKLIK